MSFGAFPQSRLRRLRGSESLRKLVCETRLSKDQLVMPYFLVPGKKQKQTIQSMPGQFRFSSDLLLHEIESLVKTGVSSVLLFGVPSKKDLTGFEACSSKGIVPQTIREIKKEFPELLVMTDICLCAYLEHGHCGLVNAKGKIENDASLKILSQMALAHAEAGADLVAPSDMMDGRVGAMRSHLDHHGFEDLPIMSYSAKYASAFYGPFRDAAHSTPKSAKNLKIPKDRKTYQMDPANRREALREMQLDLQEGADILMVKPALAYLDVLREAKNKFQVPMAAYLVSGEYSMIKAAGEKGWIDEQALVREVATSVARAGADILITYHAKLLAGQI